jgi:hypothetical protein
LPPGCTWRKDRKSKSVRQEKPHTKVARQENGYFVVRFLAEDVGKDLDAVLGCQPARPVAIPETGLMWANMLRAFHVGKALTSDGEPSSWMRPSRVA